MLTRHIIQLDMLRPEPTPRIHVKQGDTLSRNVEIRLLSDGTPWEIPEGAKPVIRYFSHDPDTGKLGRGIYDTMPNGQPAWRYSGNVLEFFPVPAMLARPGIVRTDIAFLVGERTIGTFDFEFYVNPSPADGTEPQAQNYYRVTTLEQINKELESLPEIRGDVAEMYPQVEQLIQSVALLQQARSDADRMLANLEQEILELKRIVNEL